MDIRSLSSCSINEVANMGYGEKDGKKLLLKLLKTIRILTTQMDLKTMKPTPIVSGYAVPTYVWSGVVAGSRNDGGRSSPASPFNGLSMAEYINTQDIGPCGMTSPQPNAYHGNDRKTQAFVWAPNIDKIKVWVEKEGILGN